MDATLNMLDDQVIQRTTVEPAASYGDRIVLNRVKDKNVRDIKLTVKWNGEEYPFAFRVPKKGEPAPAALRTSTTPSREARSSIQPAVIQQQSDAPKALPAPTPASVVTTPATTTL